MKRGLNQQSVMYPKYQGLILASFQIVLMNQKLRQRIPTLKMRVLITNAKLVLGMILDFNNNIYKDSSYKQFKISKFIEDLWL